LSDGIKYVLYQTTAATDNKISIGLKLINLKTAKTTDIEGLYKFLIGSLIQFRNSELVTESNEMFDE